MNMSIEVLFQCTDTEINHLNFNVPSVLTICLLCDFVEDSYVGEFARVSCLSERSFPLGHLAFRKMRKQKLKYQHLGHIKCYLPKGEMYGVNC